MFRRQIVRALTLAVTGSLLMTSVAFADDIVNNLDTSVDATAESLALTVGATATVQLSVIEREW